MPIILHEDHVAIKSGTPSDMLSTRDYVSRNREAGFTSVAMDPSHLYDVQAAEAAEAEWRVTDEGAEVSIQELKLRKRSAVEAGAPVRRIAELAAKIYEGERVVAKAGLTMNVDRGSVIWRYLNGYESGEFEVGEVGKIHP